MHRFGRSVQRKTNDRWGGVFILAVVLAVVGAWQLGGVLGNLLGEEKPAAMEPVPGMEDVTSLPEAPVPTTRMAQTFQVHFVQVGAFRSEGAARQFVQELAKQDLVAATTPRNEQGLVKVYVGPFMTGEEAAEVQSIMAETGVAKNAFTVAMEVAYAPDAVMAMTGSVNPDLQAGLDTLNNYLFEAGAWFAKRSAGEPADGGALASLGQEMRRLATKLAAAEESPAITRFLGLADVASVNAADIEVAATASPGSEEFQRAMNGYVSLLEQYRNFYTEGGSGE
ncbi:SPOR domain-containing protein [Symbiobacterium terraclitae]|uniref:SPOR domain-containing protein n=1 Tax=Symbiobacterium terraclitae TaxID=557451 RepID=UPI0035B51544